MALTENPLGGTAITIGAVIATPKITVLVGLPDVGSTAAGAVNEFKAFTAAIVKATGLADVFKKPQ
jgi:hypothetical protein